MQDAPLGLRLMPKVQGGRAWLSRTFYDKLGWKLHPCKIGYFILVAVRSFRNSAVLRKIVCVRF
ncbi:hypothetical protein KXD40_001107 [Peronospora effusa]|uniref:Uncharacterized protein n=1 Tax=Peronospora effusa TaxID=542832 RepID=A0A425C1I4_9STRA|nr:hypothetical protein DD237_008384 [Peronospora effusa]UIZ20867.1 hypothetical protein KXD40_001102 [Peronospora effusa]UIZ20870.1 hypothetical protein KXD40_001107 [Peronospora effusa]